MPRSCPVLWTKLLLAASVRFPAHSHNNDMAKEFAISVVIPAYNEEEPLRTALKRICDHLSKKSLRADGF